MESNFFLPFNMTVEDLLDPAHSSKPRNHLIAQLFYDMALIEQYGTGIGRMFNLCSDAGLPIPEMNNFSGGFRISFKSKIMATPHDTPHDINIISEQVMLLLNSIIGEMGRDTLLTKLNLKDRKYFRKAYLKPALNAELIEMNRPDALQSKQQKYRLTSKGKALLKNEQ